MRLPVVSIGFRFTVLLLNSREPFLGSWGRVRVLLTFEFLQLSDFCLGWRLEHGVNVLLLRLLVLV